MKIYLSHSTQYDFLNELYRPLQASPLNTKHEIIYFLSDDSPDKTKNSKEVIRTSDVVIADVSIRSIGIGMELGWADAFEKRIILIHQKEAQLSKYLKLLTEEIISYESSQDLVRQLEQIL